MKAANDALFRRKQSLLLTSLPGAAKKRETVNGPFPFFCAFHSACLWSNDMRGDCNARRSKELFVGVGLPTVAFGMSVVFSMTKANIFSGMM